MGATTGVVAVQMPQVGNTMEEGTIISWKVKVGDQVKVGDIIFEVETDKAAVEVEAVAAGRLAKVVVNEGETVAVLKPVAYLGESEEAVERFIAAQGEEKATPGIANKDEKLRNEAKSGGVIDSEREVFVSKSESERGVIGGTEGSEQGRNKVSPAARKIAGEMGVDVRSMGSGSGPGGRIISGDVMAAKGSATPTRKRVEGEKRRELTSMRRAIALGLQVSKQTIPHFYIEREIDAERLLKFCKERKATAPTSVNDVIVYACGRAVMEFAEFRSQIDGREMVELPAANIGVAVQTEAGLMAPVVRNIEKKTLMESAAETRRVIEAAKNGKLVGVGEAVFTVTNLGMLGVERFAAIINPPEAAILAVGAARETAVVVEGRVQAGVRMSLTLSCDHRVIDGVLAARFLNRLKEMLEGPEKLV